jgi:predicted dehydrogenase
LDLVHQAAPANVQMIEAVCKKVHGEHEDEVDARLTLSDGCEIRLFASRMADERKRFMKLEYDDGIVEIDFINRTLKNTTGAEMASAFVAHEDGLPAIADDPLGHAIGAFATAVRAGAEPTVSGADARRALATALDIISSC